MSKEIAQTVGSKRMAWILALIATFAVLATIGSQWSQARAETATDGVAMVSDLSASLIDSDRTVGMEAATASYADVAANSSVIVPAWNSQASRSLDSSQTIASFDHPIGISAGTITKDHRLAVLGSAGSKHLSLLPFNTIERSKALTVNTGTEAEYAHYAQVGSSTLESAHPQSAPNGHVGAELRQTSYNLGLLAVITVFILTAAVHHVTSTTERVASSRSVESPSKKWGISKRFGAPTV